MTLLSSTSVPTLCINGDIWSPAPDEYAMRSCSCRPGPLASRKGIPVLESVIIHVPLMRIRGGQTKCPGRDVGPGPPTVDLRQPAPYAPAPATIC